VPNNSGGNNGRKGEVRNKVTHRTLTQEDRHWRAEDKKREVVERREQRHVARDTLSRTPLLVRLIRSDGLVRPSLHCRPDTVGRMHGYGAGQAAPAASHSIVHGRDAPPLPAHVVSRLNPG
jgi:hypothetical protein